MTAPFKKRKVDASRIIKATQDTMRAVALHDAGYEPGNVYEVPLVHIRPNPTNARAIYSTSGSEEMTRSLQEIGQSTAATGFLADNGIDVVLIDGHRRWRGCESLGLSTLRVEIRPKPENDQLLYLASRAANCERENQTPLDDALVWRRLLDKKIFPSQVALSKALNISESELSRTLALAQLPGTLISALSDKESLLTLKMLNALREYWQSRGEEETLELIEKAEDLGLSYRDIENRRKNKEAPAKLRSKYDHRQLVKFGAGVGALKLYSQEGRIELSLTGLDTKESQELLGKLQGMLKV